MYYEEEVLDGVMHYRVNPNGAWYEISPKVMSGQKLWRNLSTKQMWSSEIWVWKK